MTDARTKAVEAMLELPPHREVVEAFWDEAYTHGCTDEARRWIAGEGEGQAAGRYKAALLKAALLRVDKIAQGACDSQSAASDPPPMVSAEVLIEIIDNALGGEQADTQGNDLPDTEPAAPRRIVSTWDTNNGRTVVLMSDRTLWSLVCYMNVDEWERNVDEWEWAQLPSVPQPGEGDDAPSRKKLR